MEQSIVAPNYNYFDFYGLTQTTFGVDGLPPGHPSLPDPNRPGSEFSFADNIHLNEAGYLVYAQGAFDTYRAALVPEPTFSIALLLSSIAMVGFRRRR
jgi:hypothetical protein